MNAPKDLDEAYRGADPEDFARDMEAAERVDLGGTVHPGEPGPEVGPDGRPWTRPIAFTRADALPPFPVDCLSPWLGRYVSALATETQTPVDLAGTVGLTCCALSVAKKYRVRVNDGWVEPLNLYTLSVLPPGSRKSAVFSALLGPVRECERQWQQDAGPENREARSTRAFLEKKISASRARAVQAKSSDEADGALQEVKDLESKLAGIPEPVTPRLLIDDCTVERVATLLVEQGEVLALMSAEGDAFGMWAGRYSPNGESANFAIILKGHNGDSGSVDRMGRDPLQYSSPALTIGITAQPDVLHSLAAKPAFKGRGLVQRFLFCLPKDNVGHRDVDAPCVPGGVREEYRRHLLWLLNLDRKAGCVDVTLATEAAAVFRRFREQTEAELVPSGKLAPIKEWASKMPGAVARIAGILTLADMAEGGLRGMPRVEQETMEKATRLGWYYTEHARFAFEEMNADPVLGDAGYLLGRIRSLGVACFSVRDLYQAAKGRFHEVAEMVPTLRRVEERDYIRAEPQGKRDGPGRRPSPVYHVNPLWRTE